MTSNDDALLHRFTSLINRVIAIQVEPESITADTAITQDLMLDSISLVSLMTLSEEHFGVSLADRADAIANIRTVGDALTLISAASTPAGNRTAQ